MAIAKTTRTANTSGAASATGRTLRCAIYTRKSSEEGLEQDFNSLDAQRDACEAYIRSQRHEGWLQVDTRYDDGGYSGGTMERPALRQLLSDIDGGAVNVVVVYKVDRLTRSLADFAKIVEVFDGQGASFVSVTQQFNTTTSMGRLTLNVLLSFAQFEREVTGERIRDKIAASKKKGIWMGGPLPLGYDVQERRLVINEAEADIVRSIFQRYADLGSVQELKAALEMEGVLSKVRINPAGKRTGGLSWGRGALYRLLQNRIYLGEIVHRDQHYPGEHAAIVERPLWDTVQTKLESNRIERVIQVRARAPSLLAGLLFDEAGIPMSPSHAAKGRTRYRYYVSRSLTQGKRSAQEGQRIPAQELETKVIGQLMEWLQDRPTLVDSIQAFIPAPHRQQPFLDQAAQLVEQFPELSPSQQRGILLQLVARVNVTASALEIVVRPGQLPAVLEGKVCPARPSPDETTVTLTVATQLRRCGMGIRLVVESERSKDRPDPSLRNLVVKAQALRQLLLSGQHDSVESLAKSEKVTASYVTRLLRLAFVSPEITRALLEGRQPVTLNSAFLLKDSRLPLSWDQQKARLGF